jgi:hypothetical protein
MRAGRQRRESSAFLCFSPAVSISLISNGLKSFGAGTGGMVQDFGKGDGDLSLGRTMVLRKWVIEFCLFVVIFIVERVSNGSFLQSP